MIKVANNGIKQEREEEACQKKVKKSLKGQYLPPRLREPMQSGCSLRCVDRGSCSGPRPGQRAGGSGERARGEERVSAEDFH